MCDFESCHVQAILWHYPKVYEFADLWLAGKVDNLHQTVLTRCDCLESLLHFCNDSLDLWWRTGPEYKAMSRILETRFNGLVFQLSENGIDGYTGKVWRGELLLLLCSSIATMGLIASLNLYLFPIRLGSIVGFDVSLQIYRGMLQSDRRMGCLIQWVLHQKGPRRCRKQPSLLLIKMSDMKFPAGLSLYS